MGEGPRRAGHETFTQRTAVSDSAGRGHNSEMAVPERRRSLVTVVSVLSASLGAIVIAQSGAPRTQTPVFRAGVDLIQLDVSVLDKNRHPVHGLTAADFVVREDGAAQAIDTFAEVVMPDVTTTETAWSRQIAPDVVSNQLDNHRLFAIVMDDASIEND